MWPMSIITLGSGGKNQAEGLFERGGGVLIFAATTGAREGEAGLGGGEGTVAESIGVGRRGSR